MLVKFKNDLSVACNSKLFFLKLVHERDLLKPTFRLDLRRNFLLYYNYLQVGGYRAEHFFEGLISMRLCRLNYSTMALDCNYASTQATFVMLLFASFHGYSTMIVLLALNIYILNSNKNKQQNVIAYLYVALF
jgi:hypothetical protein